MATALSTWHVVEAPAVVPHPHGIFAVAEPRVMTEAHWRLGVQWQSHGCVATDSTTSPCFIEDEIAALTPDDGCSVSTFDPFTVYAYSNAAVIGRTLDQHRDDAITRLLAGEQFGVEAEFWAMMTSEVTTVNLTGYTARYALGVVEQLLGETYGGTGVIHVNRATAIILDDAIGVSGGRMQTVLGTPVVVGAGYDQLASPPDGTGLIYGTGPVVLYRGDVDTRQSAVDRSLNEVSIIAQRDYVLGWDCTIVGAQVTLDHNTAS